MSADVMRDVAILARAVERVADAQQAAEKKGDGRTTVSTADLKLVMRMFATMYRREVAAAQPHRP